MSAASQEVMPYYFNGSEVRAVRIDGTPYLVGKDVAERLGYANPNRAMKDHCRGVPKLHPLSTTGGTQEFRVLSEPDVLRLIVRSKRPEAVEFEKWVFEVVLPTIRKTGSYAVETDPLAVLKDPAKVLELIGNYASRLQIATAATEQAVMQRDELAAAHDRFASHDGSFSITVAAKTIDCPPKKLFAWMEANGWIYRPGGRGDHVGYQTKIQQGLLTMATHEIRKTNGDIQEVSRPRVTPKGLDKLSIMLHRPKQPAITQALEEA